MKITEVLIAEHKVICGLFSQIEALLPTLSQLSELQLVTQIIEGSLERHARAEEDLLFSVFDQILENKNERVHFYQEHREIHTSLRTVKMAEKIPHARELLTLAMIVSREHFNREERLIFPQAERTLSPETLHEMGAAWYEFRQKKPINTP